MKTRRVIGRRTMTALVVNSIVGSAIFGVPSEAIRLVGSRSPLAMVIAAVLMGIIMLPIAEVASRFSDPGGLYLYARTLFGRFVGLQVGWFWLLAIVGGGAAAVNLFLTYLQPFLPSIEHGAPRILAIALLVLVPTAANYVGARQGAFLSVAFTVGKMLPLALVIGVGLLKLPGTYGSADSLELVWIAWPKVSLILSMPLAVGRIHWSPPVKSKNPTEPFRLRSSRAWPFVPSFTACSS